MVSVYKTVYIWLGVAYEKRVVFRTKHKRIIYDILWWKLHIMNLRYTILKWFSFYLGTIIIYTIKWQMSKNDVMQWNANGVHDPMCDALRPLYICKFAKIFANKSNIWKDWVFLQNRKVGEIFSVWIKEHYTWCHGAHGFVFFVKKVLKSYV